MEEQSQNHGDNNEGQDQVPPKSTEVNKDQEQEQNQPCNVWINVNQEENIDMEVQG